jgi:hypothetical protein
MNSKLTSAAITAAIFASSSPGLAHEKGTTSAPGTLTPCVQEIHAGQDEKPTAKGKAAQKRENKAAAKPDKKADKKSLKAKPKPVEAAEEDASETEGITETVSPGDPNAEPDSERRAREQRERVARERQQSKDVGEKIGRATTSAATVLADTAQDIARAMDHPGKYNPIAATWNPLGLIVGGRVSINIEYAPITHHVIVLSPHFANPSDTTAVSPEFQITNRYTGVGGELGYRYYSGHNGMNGLFIGPSLVGGTYNANLSGREVPFSNFGLAMDAGLQHMLWEHLALGAGLGIEYLYVTKDFGTVGTGASTIASSGVKPRLLAQVGYAF